MPKIIICNDATEQMLGDNIDSSQLSIFANSAWRHIWFAREKDIVVLPAPLEQNFILYMGNVLGLNTDEIKIVTSENLPSILNDKELLSDKIVSQIQKHMYGVNNWEIICYYYSSGIVRLAKKLEITPPPGAELAEQNGSDLFNRKSIFRQLSSGQKLPLAEGGIAYNINTLERLIEKCIKKTGSVIIKQDMNAGGEGNIVITKTRDKYFPGANKVLTFNEGYSSKAHKIWEVMQGALQQSLVVETYYKARYMLYSEYFVEKDNKKSTFLNNGTLRMKEVAKANDTTIYQWQGFEMPALLPLHTSARLASICARWGGLCAYLGYSGMINIDAIITDCGKVILMK